MLNFSFFSIGGCLDGCRDHTQTSGLGTRVWNLTDKPIQLQVRVGSILKKGHTLKPGSSKRLECKSIYKTYMPNSNGGGGGGMKGLLYYYDEACQPYIWIQDSVSDFSRMVKQQYISLEELRDCSEIRIYRDHHRGCISVRKKEWGLGISPVFYHLDGRGEYRREPISGLNFIDASEHMKD